MKNKDLELLISDYLTAVELSLVLFDRKFGSRSLFQLLRERKIDRRGTVSERITYQLHGVGCMVEYPDCCVDFDFGPNERTDGFDAWRLFNYAIEFPGRYAKYIDFSIVESDLKESGSLGEIKKIPNSCSSLYFFSESVDLGDV